MSLSYESLPMDLLARLAAGERALARLDHLLRRDDGVIAAWRARAQLREAAAQAQLAGFAAKPERILLVRFDATPSPAGPADRMAVDTHKQISFLAGLSAPALLSTQAITSLRFQSRREIWFDGPTGQTRLLEDDPENASECVDNWLKAIEDPDVLIARLPASLKLAEALRQWQLQAPLGSRLEMVGRAMLGHLAVKFGALRQPWLYLSEAFAARPRLYKPDQEDPVQWYNDFLGLVSEQALREALEIESLYSLLQRNEERIGKTARNSRLPVAAQILLEYQILSADKLREEVARRSGRKLSPDGTIKLLTALTERGIAREVTGRRSFRLWALDHIADRIISEAAVESDAPGKAGEGTAQTYGLDLYEKSRAGTTTLGAISERRTPRESKRKTREKSPAPPTGDTPPDTGEIEESSRALDEASARVAQLLERYQR